MRVYFKSLLSIVALSSFTLSTYANEAKSFISLIKTHYQSTSSIETFSLTHSYLGRSDPYQSWDFQAPTRYKAFKITEIDTKKQHYYQNVVHNFTGGQYFDEVHFQNDEESLRYERNGISLGKSAIEQSLNSFKRYKNLTLMNLDFMAVRPLINEVNTDEKIAYHQDDKANTVTLIHRPSEKSTMEYIFNIEPLRLVSITNKSRKRIYLYDDYRYNNGFYFAHSLIKKYNGDVNPSFITRIEKFEEIEQIDTGKLMLPAGYFKAASSKKLDLTVKAIANDLYLVTDDLATRNTLLKINNNDITVFGVSRNTKSSKHVIDAIKQRFPAKNITAVYVTHPYSDHISGLLPYVEQGAVIYADAYTVSAIKAFPRFSEVIKKFNFKTLSNEQVIDGVRFYVLENTRSKRQSFAFFEQDGIIFQTDFLEVAFDNTIAKILPSYSKRFIEFVRSEQLKVNRIVGFHRNNNILPEVVNQSYQANTM
ncbi:MULTISPECIES: MBL fold metallo-hydrolase [unclassified Pseudoalteromonas]|uniref:MBL fold metallo-hydrolase n=1 Tax=unclassified Pseudoalteromonas TaxID=194690 RepID=UPI00117B621D|nr:MULTISPECIES: MBL fold metallo-hydrolase [unclassified Pseudoalteromonas]MDP2635680.1 MBL fold metallo-hydrolase [Pseudoalteromonas sp. 1_MG-2023]